MASIATSGTRLPSRSVGFGAAVASEWTKLTTVRSTWLAAIIGLALSIGIVALIAFADANVNDIAMEERDPTDTIYTPLAGTIFATIAFTVIGVNLVASEYSSGMIRLTLTATPRRGRVVLAKMLVTATFTLVLFIVATAGMYIVSDTIYGAAGIPKVSISDSDMFRTLLGVSLLGPMYPLLGAAFAFLLRSTAGAITSVVAIMFLPSIIGALLPEAWQENLLAYLPSSAADSVSLHHLDADNPMYAEPAVALVAVIAWVAVFIAVAWFVVKRRDA